MKILLADRQDITRAGLSYVIEKMEGLESKYVEDKAELMLALKDNEDTVVILDYTNFDINDAAELLILNQRFPYTRWLLFSEDLSTDFVKVLVASQCPRRHERRNHQLHPQLSLRIRRFQAQEKERGMAIFHHLGLELDTQFRRYHRLDRSHQPA